MSQEIINAIVKKEGAIRGIPSEAKVLESGKKVVTVTIDSGLRYLNSVLYT